MSDQAVEDRGEVLARMREGQTMAAATADFASDQHFEEWYSATLIRLQTIIGG